MRELADDWARFGMDREANLTEYSSVRAGGETAAVTGEGIRVGELVMLRQDDEVPCDMVQLPSG